MRLEDKMLRFRVCWIQPYYEEKDVQTRLFLKPFSNGVKEEKTEGLCY